MAQPSGVCVQGRDQLPHGGSEVGGLLGQQTRQGLRQVGSRCGGATPRRGWPQLQASGDSFGSRRTLRSDSMMSTAQLAAAGARPCLTTWEAAGRQAEQPAACRLACRLRAAGCEQLVGVQG